MWLKCPARAGGTRSWRYIEAERGNTMKVMQESQRYNEYFAEVQGFYSSQEKKEEVEPIAQKLKTLREMQHLSQEQFSRVSGIPSDKLKMIEEGEILPDLGTVVKLSRALKVGTGFLLDQESGYSYSIVRKEDRKKIARHAAGYRDRPNYLYQSLVSGIVEKHMESFLVTLTTEEGSGELSSHEGEEFIVVMEGAIRVQLGNKEEVLNEGDTIYYLSNIPHIVKNESKTDNAVILAVLYTG
ncbi:MAG: cupin domain-containing protein [Spirochaetes bacterium]|nr:cupin domain-containing protein [Spirochaetota bacterium]